MSEDNRGGWYASMMAYLRNAKGNKLAVKRDFGGFVRSLVYLSTSVDWLDTPEMNVVYHCGLMDFANSSGSNIVTRHRRSLITY